MTDKDAVARKLADHHYFVEEGITHIFRLTGRPEAEARPEEPIKLLEVNENTVPSGVMPLGFGTLPEAGIPFPSVIVEVTPEEFKQIQAHELKIPLGWTIGALFEKPVPNGAE